MQVRERLCGRWADLRDSLWFLPALITVACGLAAIATVRIDEIVQFRNGPVVAWLYSGGAEGARGVLSAISSTMINVTALVFSITVVALQLASSQLSPRVLRSFMADRGNQVVLGGFIGTFTYALLTLRVVRSPLEERGGFVPALAVSISMLLALASVGLLIYFVHHAANGMRANVVMDRVVATTIAAADRIASDEQPAHDPAGATETVGPAVARRTPPAQIGAGTAGYLRHVGRERLTKLAADHSVAIQVLPRVGDFVLPGEPLARVWPDSAVDAAFADDVRAGLALWAERDANTDVALGLTQLADIAIRALSPGVNDPTTAIQGLDRIAHVLGHLARNWPDAGKILNGDCLRLVVVPLRPFGELVALGFGAVVPHAADDAVVASHLAALARRVASLAPPERAAPLLAVADIAGRNAAGSAPTSAPKTR